MGAASGCPPVGRAARPPSTGSPSQERSARQGPAWGRARCPLSPRRWQRRPSPVHPRPGPHAPSKFSSLQPVRRCFNDEVPAFPSPVHTPCPGDPRACWYWTQTGQEGQHEALLPQQRRGHFWGWQVRSRARIGSEGRQPWHSGVSVPEPRENDPGTLTSLRGVGGAFYFVFGVRGSDGRRRMTSLPGSVRPPPGCCALLSRRAKQRTPDTCHFPGSSGSARAARSVSAAATGAREGVSHLPVSKVHPLSRDVLLLVVSVPFGATHQTFQLQTH